MKTKDKTTFKRIMADPTHNVMYYGFQPECRSGVLGFCGSCRRTFNIRQTLTETYKYSDVKNVYLGTCPHCEAQFRMVDIKLTASEYQEKQKEQARLEAHLARTMTPEQLMAQERLKMMKAWRIKPEKESVPRPSRKLTAAENQDAMTVTRLETAIRRFINIRSYYRTQMQNAFASEIRGFGDDDTLYEPENPYMDHETSYYTGVVNLIAHEIATSEINQIWWLSRKELMKFGYKSMANRSLVIRSARRLALVINQYEEDNYDAYFGVEITTRVMNHERIEISPRYRRADVAKWILMNPGKLSEVKTRLLPADRKVDEFVDENLDEVDNEYVDLSGATTSPDTTIVSTTENDQLDDDKNLDELEFGVDDIPDV